ncbi:MAG: DUF6506 family protein [Veillonellales bacterium]
MLKAAFIFLAPQADAARHRAVVETPAVELTVVGAEDYKAAAKAAQELTAQGVGAIELCGGFGIEGVAAIKTAVAGKAVIGAVRFDLHPGLDNKSGDAIFR